MRRRADGNRPSGLESMRRSRVVEGVDTAALCSGWSRCGRPKSMQRSLPLEGVHAVAATLSPQVHLVKSARRSQRCRVDEAVSTLESTKALNSCVDFSNDLVSLLMSKRHPQGFVVPFQVLSTDVADVGRCYCGR